jgi:hypothetical protein
MIAAVVVIAPLAVVVVSPAGGLVPARRRGPAVRRLPALGYHPTDRVDPDRTEVVGSRHPQVYIVQDVREVKPDVIANLDSQPVQADRTFRHCMLLRQGELAVPVMPL